MDSILEVKATYNDRLDKYIVNQINESRNQIISLIKYGNVFVNENIIKKPSYKVVENDKIKIIFPNIEKTKSDKKVNFDIETLYEDQYLMVINKPSGLIVHEAPSHNEVTIVDWLKSKNISLSTINGDERHGIVHRLDKGTSGAMVIAKTNEVHQMLSNQLQNKTMGRYYLALIDMPLKESIVIDKPIARNRNNRLKMGIVSNGKNAKTAFAKLLLNEEKKLELIACKLFTGRTHQIRVHLESIQRHIVNDNLYGYKENFKVPMERILLHAYKIYFVHPISKQNIKLTAPIPNGIKNYLENIFNKESLNEKILPSSFEHHFDDANSWLCKSTTTSS